MTSDITWGPEIRVDGKRPEWLGDGPQPMLLHNEVGWHTWRVSQVDPALVAWSFNDHRPNVDLIRLPADHPHYAASGGEVGPEVVATLRSAVRRILSRCEAIEEENSDQLAKEQTEASSGFLRGERHLAKSIRRELHDLTRGALLPEPVDGDAEIAKQIMADHSGGNDREYRMCLAAIKRGRALAAGDR